MSVKTLNDAPKQSTIKDSFGKVHYQDSVYITFTSQSPLTVDFVLNHIFRSTPPWAGTLVRWRNKIVKLIGFKAVVPAKDEEPDMQKVYQPGERAVFFKVLKRNENEIVMAEDDIHLNFRTSVMLLKLPQPDAYQAYLSTAVHYNNILGRLYFIPVKPFHRLLVKVMLKNFLMKFPNRNK